jgi:superfamily II DNA or RNA helicase
MFDVVICDECHHIAARVFSKAMLRFPAKYTMGLSATPERKDGLTRVVKWFIGDKVVTADAGLSRPVCMIRRHVYAHQCATKCDYGKDRRQNYGKHAPLLPQMISDMTQCVSRTRWIVDLVADVLQDEPGRNILIVSDRVQHLRDMCDLITRRIPSAHVGMYIGSMKQCDRDIVAKECNVILGTYALTREGLDIQKLDTLVIATPTGDIVQTVGRILRSRNNAVPLVLDVVDKYSVFTSQSIRRMKYFVSQNYRICDTSGEKSDSDSETQDYAFIEEDSDVDLHDLVANNSCAATGQRSQQSTLLQLWENNDSVSMIDACTVPNIDGLERL